LTKGNYGKEGKIGSFKYVISIAAGERLKMPNSESGIFTPLEGCITADKNIHQRIQNYIKHCWQR
jgi:hypothetical protein